MFVICSVAFLFVYVSKNSGSKNIFIPIVAFLKLRVQIVVHVASILTFTLCLTVLNMFPK